MPDHSDVTDPDDVAPAVSAPESAAPESAAPEDDEVATERERRRARRREARERRQARVDREADRQAEREAEDRITARIAAQWAVLREEREERMRPGPIRSGPSNFSRAQVPWGLDLAAAWGWRLLVIAAASYVVLWLVAYFAVITLPIAIALLLAALAGPVVNGLRRLRLPRGVASILTVLLILGSVGLLLTFAGQQIAEGADDLADSTVEGLEQIETWLKDGPLNASDSQIDTYISDAQAAITEQTADQDWFTQATELGTAVGHVFAGFFIVLFATYFFLADGNRIWSWVVRLAPRAARAQVDSSGRVAWRSLTQFVRATVLVAGVDAIGIMTGAWVLDVPFVLAIGVLVFLGAFVPLIGATVAGAVAVLVALVDQGPVTALLMFAVVIGVQQLEGHVLQPFLMGRWVSVHPLGVIVAIGCGVLVAGVAGALVAVPLAAAANAVVLHLAEHTAPGADAEAELLEDYETTQATVRQGDVDHVDRTAPPE